MLASIVGNVIVPFIIFIVLAVWNGMEGGSAAVMQGIQYTGRMMVGVAIVILIAFLITGQAQMLVGRHMPKVIDFLNGKHGIWGAAGAGMIAPTMSAYPVVQGLWQAGTAPIGVLLTIILTSRIINFQTVMFFLPFLGWRLTLISMVVGAGVIASFILAVNIITLIGKMIH